MHFHCGGDGDLLCCGLITTINRGWRFSGIFSHNIGSFEHLQESEAIIME